MVRFNTQPPEGGWQIEVFKRMQAIVSTHSRPKAAAKRSTEQNRRLWFQHTAARRRLSENSGTDAAASCFNTQPPEGGCTDLGTKVSIKPVSTHSRPKAAEPP